MTDRRGVHCAASVVAADHVPFPDAFVTARLSAERLMPEHLAELRLMDRDPEVMGMLGGVREEAQTLVYLERNLKHWSEYGFGLWILREGERGRVAGRAVLRHLLVEGRDEVEVGYGFYPEIWGRGLATEIAAACLEFARDALHQSSVVAITLPANLASQRVMTKVGLAYERDFDLDGDRHVLFRSPRLKPGSMGAPRIPGSEPGGRHAGHPL